MCRQSQPMLHATQPIHTYAHTRSHIRTCNTQGVSTHTCSIETKQYEKGEKDEANEAAEEENERKKEKNLCSSCMVSM